MGHLSCCLKTGLVSQDNSVRCESCLIICFTCGCIDMFCACKSKFSSGTTKQYNDLIDDGFIHKGRDLYND